MILSFLMLAKIRARFINGEIEDALLKTVVMLAIIFYCHLCLKHILKLNNYIMSFKYEHEMSLKEVLEYGNEDLLHWHSV